MILQLITNVAGWMSIFNFWAYHRLLGCYSLNYFLPCRAKYELQEFLKPSLRIVSLPSEKGSLKSSFSRKLMDSFRSNSSHNSVTFLTFSSS